MDTLPVEILARIFGYCNLETAVALSQTFKAASDTWSSLDTSVVRLLVLGRAPWFVLNESGTGLSSWTQCALTTVSRTNATKHSLRRWRVIKEETARDQICGREESRFKKPLQALSLVKSHVVWGADVVPKTSKSTTKVRHMNPSVSVTLLNENDVFLHFANSLDKSKHNIINKSLCARDKEGTWVVANEEFLDDFAHVTLLPNSSGAFLTSFCLHNDLHVDSNTPLRVQLFHLPPSVVPVESLLFEWQHLATRVGPNIYLETHDTYYYETAVNFSMVYNGFFYAMFRAGYWVRLWIDLEATDSDDEQHVVLSVNSKFPVIHSELMTPHMSTHIRCNKKMGLDRYFVLPYQKLSWIGDLLTGLSYHGETLYQSQTERSTQIAPFFSRSDKSNPGFYTWNIIE